LHGALDQAGLPCGGIESESKAAANHVRIGTSAANFVSPLWR
jgi:hypothetical protein